jgi:hypothetical protein
LVVSIAVTPRRWIAVLLGALLVAACVAVPSLARRRAEDAIAQRSGCTTRVGSVWPGRILVLEGVLLECDFGTLDFARVEVDWRWSGDIAAVRVSGGTAVLRGRPHVQPRTVPAESGSEPAVGEGGVSIALESLRVELIQPDGTAIVSTTVDAELGSQQLRLVARDVSSNPTLSPSIQASELRLLVERGTWILDELAAERGSVTVGDGPPLENALREWAASPSSTNDALEEEREGSPRPLWERVRTGASIQIEDASIQDREGVALGSLHAELTRLAGSSFRTRGRGQPRGTGELSWDVHVDVDGGQVDGPVTLREVPLSVVLPFLPSLPLHDPSRALISADLRVQTEPDQTVAATGRVQVEGLGLEHSRIASAPVLGISFVVDGSGRWRRAEHAVELDRATLRMGTVQATLAGRAMMDGDRFSVDLRAELPSTPCDAAVHAIPAGMLQELQQIHLEGRLAANLVARVDSEHLDDTTLRIAIDDRCRFTSVPALADVARFQGPFQHEVLEPNGTVFTMETGPGTGTWTPITEISPFLVHAVLAHEDASFFTHSGFAPWAIRDALVRNLRERRYVLGASTITMQLVKNVFLRREKTLARKVQEVLLTWWIESAMTKAQILELYLNVIEYGPAVYGIRNAAAHYFGRSPSELSVAESAYLAMILPNPPRFHEHYDAAEVPVSFRRRTAGFIGILEHRGRIDAEAAAQGREEIEGLVFSRNGERVGPDLLRGGSAQLPIEGFSGFPAASWSEADPATDEEPETADENDSETSDDAWEEVWP